MEVFIDPDPRSEVFSVSSGLSHFGAVSRDGLLHVVQSDRRNDRSVHCSGEFGVLPGRHSVDFLVFLPSVLDASLCCVQVLMSQSVILALSPFAVAAVVCSLGNFLLPIETKGRALLVRNTFYYYYFFIDGVYLHKY